MQDPRHPVPTEIPADAPLSATVRRPKLYLRLEDLFPPLSFPARRRALAVGVAAIATVAILLLWPWVTSRAQPPTGDGGVPDGTPGGVTAQTQGSIDETTRETYESEPPTDEAECQPTDTAEPPAPDESGSAEDSGSSVEDGTSQGDSTDNSPATTPVTTEEVTPSPTDEGDGEATADTETRPDTQVPTAPPDTAPAETEPPIPAGCLGFVSVDKSESHLGAGYVERGDLTIPEALPADSPWKGGSPAVLIVNTHPYEGYGGGAAWYDPAAGGLALTDSPNDPDGVVALGAALARTLRDSGITVIHLRVPVSAGDSASAILARTEEAIRYYRRLYPDIGLVLDLRRSAELTADGSILATKGDYNGVPCAQLRVSVNGGRASDELGYDLAVAISLRESLWNTAPTLSRPVRVKSGSGIAGDSDGLRVLTLEFGSAGNTYDEAKVLVAPLGRAISAVLKKYS